MLKLLALDRFTLLLFVMVLLASFVPVSGQAASVFGVLTTVAIAILFFLHGAKLSREASDSGHDALETPRVGFCIYLHPFSRFRFTCKTCIGTTTWAGAVLGLFVYVLFAIDSTVFNCVYFGCTRQCGWGGM